MPKVGVVLGSKSDMEVVQPAVDILTEMGIDCELNVISAHRTPEKAREYGLNARSSGIEVIIAAAGMAAHLPRKGRDRNLCETKPPQGHSHL